MRAARKDGRRRRSANAPRPARTGTCPAATHSLDDALELVERRRDRPRDGGLRAARPRRSRDRARLPELLVVELELLAGGQDGRRPGRRAAAVADGGLQPERDHHSPRGRRVAGIRADGIEEALLGRQILGACRSRLDLLRLSLARGCSALGRIHRQHRLIEQDRLLEGAVAVETAGHAPGRRRRYCRSRCSRLP